MSYFVALNSRLNFIRHFARLAPKNERVANFLGRLLPSVNDPGNKPRAVYMGSIKSVVLYGAPIWHINQGDRIAGNVILRRAQRNLAIIVVRGYRTINFQAGMTIVGMFPLLANVEARVYHRVGAMKNEGHMTFDWEIENMCTYT